MCLESWEKDDYNEFMIKLKRRHFVQGIVASVVLGAFYSWRKLWNKGGGEKESHFASFERLSIIQGATSATEAQISICFLKALKLRISVMDSLGKLIVDSMSESTENFQFLEHTVPQGDYDFLTLRISQLSLQGRYTLIVKNDEGQELDRRSFKTLDVNKNEAVCALISCAHDRHMNIQERMWRAVENSKPDVLFLLGDNVYIDWHERLPPSGQVDEAHIWNRIIEIRNLFYLYKMPTLIPIFATWDDHDTGTNDSNKDTPLIKEAAKIFDVVFPRHEIHSLLEKTYGVGYHLKLFGLEIMMMDSHSFRSAKADPNQDNPKFTHWGIDQERKMERVLQDAKAPVWIMNGNQFFGGYRQSKESYEWVHNSNFNNWFLKKIKESAKPVLLTSGDIHYSEVQRIEPEVVGYPLYEITSSSIHSKTKYLTPPKVSKDGEKVELIESNVGNRRLAATGEFNFVVSEIKSGPDAIKVVATSRGRESAQYFSETFVVSKQNNHENSI